MLFHTLDFAAFFGVVVLLYGLLGGRWLLLALTGASYFFYGYLQPYYAVLLFLLTLCDYVIGLVAGRFKARWHGVLVSFVVNFGALAYFKYTNFGLENARVALELLGLRVEVPRVDVVLPIGISFHVFQSFAYVMEVLYGRIAPCRSFLLYALYVSWFPQLVAGPIERPARLIPQLAAVGETRAGFASRLPHAAALFAEGWIRKLAADVLSSTADAFFDAPAGASTADAVFGIVAFGLQIYGDFSGYSRMAQGASHALGVELMENFDRPYAARSFRDFWRRWHISLSTWFRDYVYVPLGGNRRGPARERANVVATMLLSALWHGAAWTFLLWGAMHAALLVLESVTRGFWRRAPAALDPPPGLGRRLPRLGPLPGPRLRLGARVLPRPRAGGLGPALARLPVRGGRPGRGRPRPRPPRGAGSTGHGPGPRLGERPGRALGVGRRRRRPRHAPPVGRRREGVHLFPVLNRARGAV